MFVCKESKQKDEKNRRFLNFQVQLFFLHVKFAFCHKVTLFKENCMVTLSKKISYTTKCNGKFLSTRVNCINLSNTYIQLKTKREIQAKKL